MMKKVFVYGTLMSGERASDMLDRGSFLGEYTLNGYTTYDLGPFPGIKEDKEGEVLGELYDIPDSLIQSLDSYEGEGGLYKRTLVTVRNAQSVVNDVFVYVYLGSVSDCARVLGRWAS